MNLRVLLPAEVLLDQEVKKVIAEAENGSFALLPRHIDFVSALVPGILTYVTPDGSEHFLALDEGILVKQGDQVYVSVARAIPGDDLEQLQDMVEHKLKALGESDKTARSVMARLEVDTLRRFTRLGGER
ncbi:MAG: F0F1 ATP synthase subunit epsilon [Thermaerobacterales bacterium]